MIDVFNIQDNSLNNQIFYFTGTNSWQTWHKPPNTKFINFFLVGGGAGGQSGGLNAASTRNGGAGGGSAASSYITVPSFAVPDILYIQVGGGGTGGTGTTSNAQGGTGGISYVSLTPDNTLPHMILIKSGSAAAGVSTSATAGAAITVADVILCEIAFLSSYAGQTGGAGGASSGVAAFVTPTGVPFTSGAGGAGCSSVGTLGTSAGINSIFDFPRLVGGTNSTTGGVSAGVGQNGYSTRENFLGVGFRTPLFFTGGAGGGANSSSTGLGGNGGNAAFGCGGGGGGAGGNTIAGNGGRGGDGFVVITAS